MNERPPRRTRAEQRELTRSALLDAAAAAFADHGVDGASIDDIAARAGFSRGAFYSNFADKTDLLIALCDARLAAFAATELPAILAAPPEQQLAVAARWLAAEQPPLEVLLIVELARQLARHPEQADALTAAIERVVAAVEGLLTTPDGALPALPPVERRARATAVLAAILGADLLRHLGLAVDERAMELLLRGVAGEERER